MIFQGDDLLFEPNQTILGSRKLSSPDAIMTMQPDGSILVPVENREPLCTWIDKGTSLGWVTQPGEILRSDADSSTEEVAMGTVLHVEADTAHRDERGERLLTALGLEQGDLTEQQFHELKSVIKQNADVFALEDSELGCPSVVQHAIHTDDHPPINSDSPTCWTLNTNSRRICADIIFVMLSYLSDFLMSFVISYMYPTHLP